MTEKYYTLKELADEHGFPFDAVKTTGYKFHCVAIKPNGDALGWGPVCTEHFSSESWIWKLDKPEPKKTRFYRCDVIVDWGGPHIQERWIPEEGIRDDDKSILNMYTDYKVYAIPEGK